MADTPKGFIWYELMTSDLKAAETFYTAVVGWKAQPFPNSPMPYVVMNAGDRGVGGLMTIPDDVKKMGGRPSWLGYIYADDVDARTAAIKKAGGSVMRPPTDIPEVGRFAVVADPQGAVFMLLKPMGPDRAPVPMTTPGHVGWHELYTSDWQAAMDFYAGQFGWSKGEAMDMGAMGKYQLFSYGGEQQGGIMNKPPNVPSPVWGFYFTVDAIDAASKRVTDGGGKILNGPMEVPGGSWMIQGADPQGAMFALVSARR